MNKITFSRSIPGLSAEEVLVEENYSMSHCHMHETSELLFMLEGERYWLIEQDIYHLKPGMAILINRNQLHQGNMIDKNATFRRFLLYLDEPVLESYFSLPEAPGIRGFGDNYWGVAEYIPEDWQKSLTIFEMLKQELDRNDSSGNTMAVLLTVQLMTLFARNRRKQENILYRNPNPERSIHAGIHQTVHEIAIYLQNHSGEPCSLDDVAAHFFISRSYLTRIFKSVTGFTVTEYLMICRVRKAKMLLDKTDLNITEISTQIGFGSISYFERIFKRMTDLTPLQYRKRNL